MASIAEILDGHNPEKGQGFVVNRIGVEQLRNQYTMCYVVPGDVLTCVECKLPQAACAILEWFSTIRVEVPFDADYFRGMVEEGDEI